MKILLIGHGRMGQLIEQTALSAGDSVVAVYDETNITELSKAEKIADVLIDFSSPASLPYVREYVERTGTPLLSGTTGMTPEDLVSFHQLGKAAPVIHSANYSVGIAVFRRMLQEVSSVLKEDFDIEIVEAHHNQKVDAPSGTAKLLLSAIDPDHEQKIVHGREGICGKRDKKEIGVHAIRGGTVAGIHTVGFYGTDEILEITHTATSRQIFVNGALTIARKLYTLPCGSYDLQDILFGGTAQ